MKHKIHKVITRALDVKPNTNSADAISPNYVYGCLGGCMSTYCYVNRYNPDEVRISQNVSAIHYEIMRWAEKLQWPKQPNQQDPVYYMVDIGCNTDIALHQKHIDFDRILRFYNEHPRINLTFATKYSKLLKKDVRWMQKKPRVRVSLMPEEYSSILEPNTTPILERIEDIDRLQELGWEVHINFSPVIIEEKWEENYKYLFNSVHSGVYNRDNVKCEVIFLTMHTNTINRSRNAYATALMLPANELKHDWVMRYPMSIKRKAVDQFTNWLADYLPWCKIRYIF